jgi:hypothetical protein
VLAGAISVGSLFDLHEDMKLADIKRTAANNTTNPFFINTPPYLLNNKYILSSESAFVNMIFFISLYCPLTII